MPDTNLDDQKKRILKIKNDLEGWREVIIPLNDILLWEKNWYPGMLIGVTSTFFLMFWYFDPSVLTTASVIGLIITLVDYLVPTLTAYFSPRDCWTGVEEKKLEEICKSLAILQIQFLTYWSSFYDLRGSRPKVYYSVVAVCLLFLSWLGNVMDNLLLSFILVTGLLLLPGMKHHGILNQFPSQVSKTINQALSRFKQKKN